MRLYPPAYFRDRRLADIRQFEAATQYGCQETRPVSHVTERVIYGSEVSGLDS
jgi:hypothetical protein